MDPSFLILDIDGVFTDGSFLYSAAGKTHKRFGPHDHDGVKLIKPHLRVVCVTADRKGFAITHKRIVEDMGVELLLLSESDRLIYLMDHFDLPNNIYMGDGIHDVRILRACRFGIAPANARPEVIQVAQYVTPSQGGNGAVLDACLKVLEVFFSEAYRKVMRDLSFLPEFANS